MAGITDNVVAVQGSLSVTLDNGHTITRENFGHGQINKGFPLGNALKTASVDAMKKCCSMFGIGLHLYDGDEPQPQVQHNGHAKNNGNGQHNGQDFPDYEYPDYEQEFNGSPKHQSDVRFDVSGDPSPATSRQIIALQNIAKSPKTDPALASEITKALNTPTEHNGGPPRVSKSKASEFISQAFN